MVRAPISKSPKSKLQNNSIQTITTTITTTIAIAITTMTAPAPPPIITHLLSSTPLAPDPALHKKFSDPLLLTPNPPAPRPRPSPPPKRSKPLSAKQRRALGLNRLPDASCARWELYAGLRRLWGGYAREVLFGGRDAWAGGSRAGGDGGAGKAGRVGVAQDLCAKVAALEFSGAEVLVVRHRNVEMVGVRGTVVREGRGGLWVVRREGGWRCVPKEGGVFEVVVRPPEEEEGDGDRGMREVRFRVLGDGIICRAAERANRKFKGRLVKD